MGVTNRGGGGGGGGGGGRGGGTLTAVGASTVGVGGRGTGLTTFSRYRNGFGVFAPILLTRSHHCDANTCTLTTIKGLLI